MSLQFRAASSERKLLEYRGGEFNSADVGDGEGRISGAGGGGRGAHRFSTITFPSCGAWKFRGATDIAVPRSVVVRRPYM